MWHDPHISRPPQLERQNCAKNCRLICEYIRYVWINIKVNTRNIACFQFLFQCTAVISASDDVCRSELVRKSYGICDAGVLGSYAIQLARHCLVNSTKGKVGNDPAITKIHYEPKKDIKMFSSYLPQNPVDSDKIWYTSS